MVTEVSLRKYYENIKTEFPEIDFDEISFVEGILIQLRKDGIRTGTVRKSIENEGLEFILRSFYPLNDFFYATRDYLLQRGVEVDELRKFDWHEFERHLYEN